MNPVGTPAKQQALSYWCKRMYAKGWVANHDGNVSLRCEDGQRFMASPTATSKNDVEPQHIVTVDLAGKKLSGRKRLFSEWHLHAACYRARSDAHAVIHAHPPNASAIGLAGQSLGVPAMPEVIVSLGAHIPTIARALPKSSEQDAAIQHALTEGDAEGVLLSGNGVLCVGADLEQAFLRLELIEHYATIMIAAHPLGGVVSLADTDVQTLLNARTKAGLGRKGRSSS